MCRTTLRHSLKKCCHNSCHQIHHPLLGRCKRCRKYIQIRTSVIDNHSYLIPRLFQFYSHKFPPSQVTFHHNCTFAIKQMMVMVRNPPACHNAISRTHIDQSSWHLLTAVQSIKGIITPSMWLCINELITRLIYLKSWRKKYIPCWEHNKFKTSLAQIYLRGAQ